MTDFNPAEVFASQDAESYEARVAELEAEGLTRSDAQAVIDAEDMMKGA